METPRSPTDVTWSRPGRPSESQVFSLSPDSDVLLTSPHARQPRDLHLPAFDPRRRTRHQPHGRRHGYLLCVKLRETLDALSSVLTTLSFSLSADDSDWNPSNDAQAMDRAVSLPSLSHTSLHPPATNDELIQLPCPPLAPTWPNPPSHCLPAHHEGHDRRAHHQDVPPEEGRSGPCHRLEAHRGHGPAERSAVAAAR